MYLYHKLKSPKIIYVFRQFLWSFRLPGEAQKIDRMMECFAERYCQLNPNIFTNTGKIFKNFFLIFLYKIFIFNIDFRYMLCFVICHYNA